MGKGGIVSDPKVHMDVLNKMYELVSRLGMYPEVLTYSPIQGATGNTEFLMLMTKDADAAAEVDIEAVVRASGEEFR